MTTQDDNNLVDRGAALLASIQVERGYLLSYHRVFARLDPRFMRTYDDLYRVSILEERFLSKKQRELIWLPLLTLIKEEVGAIHFRRAVQAGATREEIGAAVALASVAGTWDMLSYADENWDEFVGDSFSKLAVYEGYLAAVRGPLDERQCDLVLLVLHAARRSGDAYLFHLKRLLSDGTPEEEVAEAISYLLQPLGANSLLWATDAWLDAVHTRTVVSPSRLDRDATEGS